RPFDLAAGPLLHGLLVRDAGSGRHRLLLSLHHAVTDGWSTEVLLDDLLALYAAERAGRPAGLAPLPVRYGDFAAWQRARAGSPAVARDIDYWRRQLAGVPALELPTDAPRPPAQTFTGAAYPFRLPADLVAGLEALGRAHGATLFMTLLAGWQALLSRWCGQVDFAVGSPVAGRVRPELERLVGMFVTMLPLRADLSGDPTGAELLDRTRRTVLDGLAHQEVPFEKVVDELKVVRDVSRSPLFQVMAVLQNYEMPDHPSGSGGTGGSVAWHPVELPATRFDLELHAYAGPDGLECKLVYNTALFEPPTVQRLAGHLRTLLADLVARPEAPVGELALLDGGERDRVLVEWATGPAGPVGGTLPELVAEQVRRTPGAVAVVDERRRLTYRELDAAANRVAHRLAAAGAGVESVVAVCAERGVDLVVALLGVLRSGAAYLPLDPDYPADRLSFMLADSGAAALLSQHRLAGTVPAGNVPTLLLDEPAEWAGQPDTDPGVAVPDLAAAYVIYTSGSTGRPKGVLNAHRGIVNRLRWMQDEYGLGADDVVLQKTPASFDVSVWEFFWPLVTGARLVLARPGGHRDPAYLRRVIDEHRVTTVHFVPSMLAAFLAEPAEPGCGSLRLVVCSGEELPVALARRCLDLLPQARLSNLYGPTEAAVDVTAFHCDPAVLAARTRVPIGRPVANTRTYVLDDRLRPVPAGAAGQLHLGGLQVARGYANRPGLTAERFRPDPYGPPGSRLYATGDAVRWRDDGTLEFLGRLDGQVKLRGLRIELGEIEAALRDRPGVRDAAAAVREVAPGDRRLIAYVIPDAAPPDEAALRAALAARLPDYMVPTAFVPLDRLPLSPAGKLDRAALPAPDLAPAADRETVEPATEAERAVADIWRDVLRLDRVGVDEDFFALGGHSLLATQVVARMRRLTAAGGRQVGVMDLFQHPTVRGLAALLEGPGGGPRPLLYELTRPVPARDRVRSYVCVPYGGGSAVVYQPLADALPPGHTLYSVAIPGHDVGLDEDPLPFDELAARCTAEILSRVDGPLVLYGHCGVGGALIVELARRLEAAGRELEAVYVGGMFPFARPKGALSRLHTWLDDLASNRSHANWLKSMGVDMDELDPAQAERIIANMRHDSRSAEEHFTGLLDARVDRLRAPIISVVGERDPITDYYQERYAEWSFLADTMAAVVLDEAGHFFLRYRAADVAEILTEVHPALAAGRDGELAADARGPGARWWLHAVTGAASSGAEPTAVRPSMRRFLAVATGQLVTITGSALTAWALPIYVYLRTGSLGWFGLSGVLAFLPMLLALPLAGAVADRSDRRKVIIAASCVAAGVESVLAALVWTDRLPLWLVYLLAGLIGFAAAFQRIAFTAAIPQLAPKRFLGHANGVVQLINGSAQLLVPLVAAALLAAIGLRGILLIDVVSYAVALAVLAVVRFPALMGRRRREPFLAELLGGLRLTWGTKAFRDMLIFFSVGNFCLAGPMLLVTPLVLAFGTMTQVGQVAFFEGLGAAVGGLGMTLWGGPRRRRMVAIIGLTALVGVFCAVTGLRASLPVVAFGVFGTALGLAVANGIYLTIIQVKVPQRFHGRVIALNTATTWATFPLGFAILAPLSGWLFEPLLAPDGALAGTVGQVIGTGAGRGIGFSYLVFGFAMVLVALAALRVRSLVRLDEELPDALPDDLVGMQELESRAAGTNRPDRERVPA
ncbi:MAG: amino acid adenylation domain-containing protein, partial [Mycobacteriales bacterium]